MILGIDEVGRGCWAGPLVVGAVVLGGAKIEGLTDSKKLSKKRREALNLEIHKKADGVGLGWVSATEVDELGLSKALALATKRAVKAVKVPFHEIILDGTVNFLRQTALEDHVSLMPKADLLVPSVSAASIVAKVARDNYMIRCAEDYPQYGFENHVGYGTLAHRLAIDVHGVISEHRLSFAPLSKYQLASPKVEASSRAPAVAELINTTRAIGDASETAAADELVRRGHQILARNWKTKSCEIDIVSIKDQIYYFTEVKHRKNNLSGDGLAAITPRKLARMRYAAELYVHFYKLTNCDRLLLAVATTGQPPLVESIVEIG